MNRIRKPGKCLLLYMKKKLQKLNNITGRWQSGSSYLIDRLALDPPASPVLCYHDLGLGSRIAAPVRCSGSGDNRCASCLPPFFIVQRALCSFPSSARIGISIGMRIFISISITLPTPFCQRDICMHGYLACLPAQATLSYPV